MVRRSLDNRRRSSPAIRCWACCSAVPSSSNSVTRSGSARARTLTSQALRVGRRNWLISLARSRSLAARASATSAVRWATKSSGEIA